MRRAHVNDARAFLRERKEWLGIGGVLLAALLLRIAMMVAIRPITYGLNDSGTYLAAASGRAPSLFYDVHHPVGYSMFLAVVSPIVQTGTGLSILQHVMGLGAGLLLFLAGRRFGAPIWAAVLAAAAYVLSIDVIALEHSILSEAVFLPLVATFVYVASRLYGTRSLRGVLTWAAILGAAAGTSYTVRYTGAALFMAAPLAALVLPSGPLARRLMSTGVAALAVAGVVVPYLIAQDHSKGIGWKLLPGHGWNHYAALAPNVDCSKFTPPRGTEVLCESAAQRRRRTVEFYSWSGASPARRLEPRGFPYSDEKFEAFANAAAAAGVSGKPSSTGEKPAAGVRDKPGVLDDSAGRLTSAVRKAGIVFGPLGWAPELSFRNTVVEVGERNLAGGLLTLAPMSFHAPLQPLKDLRPLLRASGPLALASLILVLLALPRMGVRRALFCALMIAVILSWTLAGTLPRYAVPIYALSLSLLPIGVAGFTRGAASRPASVADGRAVAAGENGLTSTNRTRDTVQT